MVPEEISNEILQSYGLACYYAQCVEVELDTARMMIFRGENEKFSDEEWSSEENRLLTMGSLLNIIKNKLSINQDDNDLLDSCLKHRNFLAHGYWVDRVHLVASIDGCAKAIEELNEMIEVLYRGNKLVCEISAKIRQKIGISETFIKELLDEYVTRIKAGEEREAILSDLKERIRSNQK